jgi:hypothetical protein
MKEFVRTARFPLKVVRVNPWKRKIAGEGQDSDRMDYLRESMKEWDLVPGGAIGRIVNRNGTLVQVSSEGSLVIPDGGRVELANYSHRYWVASELKDQQYELRVAIGNYTNVDMLLLLAAFNRYNEFPKAEAVKLLESSIELLVKHPEVSSEFHRKRSESGHDIPSHRDVSEFLGETNWPQQRISELLSPPKPTPSVVPQIEILSPTPSVEVETSTSIQGMLDVAATSPTTPEVNDKMTKTEALAVLDGFLGETDGSTLNTPSSTKSSKAPTPPKTAEETFNSLLTNRQRVLQKDFEERVPTAFRRHYRDGLLRTLQGINV